MPKTIARKSIPKTLNITDPRRKRNPSRIDATDAGPDPPTGGAGAIRVNTTTATA